MARLWDWVDGIPDRRWGGGVYALYRGKQLVYIGRTSCFFVRLPAHRRRFEFDGIKVAPISDAQERRQLERKLIRRLVPSENRSIPCESVR
jgi:hypothetical protein